MATKAKGYKGFKFSSGPGYDYEVKDVAYHRNGVGGEGFHVVLFDAVSAKALHDMAGAGPNYVATVFPLESEAKWNGRVAVLNVNMLYDDNIAFASNSWRGDNFEAGLRAAIHLYEKARDDAPKARLAAQYRKALKRGSRRV